MKVEIVVCTWNRAGLLRQTLARLSELVIPDDVEQSFIVVDNNSTDDSAEVISEFSGNVDLVAIHEPRQGHCYARNAAISAAKSDLLLWIDDDVLVCESWLESYVRAARDQSDISFWGGSIAATFDHRQPKWIDDNFERLKGCFAVREPRNGGKLITLQEMPYGANFAIRTSVQKRFLFDTGLGRQSAGVFGEDDLDLFRRLLADGLTGCWVSGASVHHVIDRTRTTTDFVARYFEGQGRALVAKNENWSDDIDDLKRESRHELFWYRVKRLFSDSEVWLSHLIRGSLALGQAGALQELTGKQS